jgi:hypothetical protein
LNRKDAKAQRSDPWLRDLLCVFEPLRFKEQHGTATTGEIDLNFSQLRLFVKYVDSKYNL